MTFPPHLDYLKNPNIIWFNPCWGYYGFWKRLSEFQQERGIDFQTAWSHRDMKRNKEMYVTAITALCMQQDAPTRHGWWFTKPPQDPPDGIIGTMIEDKSIGGNIMKVREVEVVEYIEGSLLKTIRSKLENKSYEPNTILVCLLSSEPSKVFDPSTLSEQLKKIELSLPNVFLTFNGFHITPSLQNLTTEEMIDEMLKIAFIQLLPNYATVNVSPCTCCEAFRANKEQGWLKFTKRGRGMGLEKVTVEEAPKLFD